MNNCNYIYAQFWKEEGEKGGIVIGDTDMLKKKEGVKRPQFCHQSWKKIPKRNLW